MPGLIPGSIIFDPDNKRITPGRQNAINTAAAVFIPGVCEKISMTNPRKKEETSKSQAGVSKGNNRINKT
jgi:hypothetical protein